jgi:hypothetical protein
VGTTITTRSLFDSVEERDGVLESGMVFGAIETYDRLDEYLEVLRVSEAGVPSPG